MALSKQIGTSYGIVASYWKISELELNRIDGSAVIKVFGYYDDYARNNGATPLKTLSYFASGQDLLTYFPTGLEVAQVYAFLKAQPEFIFAEDC